MKGGEKARVAREGQRSEQPQIINARGERSHSIGVTQVTSTTQLLWRPGPAPADSGGFTNRPRASHRAVRTAVFQTKKGVDPRK